MIVEQDFFTHWKTEMLVELTGDPLAPYKLMKLWGYCQARRTCEFDNLTPQVIKSICGFEGDAMKIYEILKTKCRFIDEIERNGTTIIKVHDWDVSNASLVANWKNGAKGGRPKKPTVNPRLTHGYPNGKLENTDKEHNPRLTQGYPTVNPRLTHG